MPTNKNNNVSELVRKVLRSNPAATVNDVAMIADLSGIVYGNNTKLGKIMTAVKSFERRKALASGAVTDNVKAKIANFRKPQFKAPAVKKDEDGKEHLDLIRKLMKDMNSPMSVSEIGIVVQKNMASKKKNTDTEYSPETIRTMILAVDKDYMDPERNGVAVRIAAERLTHLCNIIREKDYKADLDTLVKEITTPDYSPTSVTVLEAVTRYNLASIYDKSEADCITSLNDKRVRRFLDSVPKGEPVNFEKLLGYVSFGKPDIVDPAVLRRNLAKNGIRTTDSPDSTVPVKITVNIGGYETLYHLNIKDHKRNDLIEWLDTIVRDF